MATDRNETRRVRAPRPGCAGPTLADVAREAGVSAMTVSRVINREANVRATTREQIEQAIARLSYVPNPAARTLAGGRQCRIALFYSNPSSAYLSELLVGSLAGAAGDDAQIIVEHWDGSEQANALVRRCRAHRIDAVLLPPPLCDDDRVMVALLEDGIIVAQVATGAPSAAACAVTIDDEAAAHAMTTYLLDLGHRRIGFVAGHPNQTASALRRVGYERALREAGVSLDAGLIQAGDFTYRSGLAAGEALLDLELPPTAIFAGNDDMAAAVVAVAHRRHRAVPDDLSVCGFDDTATAIMIWPELTTIRQPIAAMAGDAVRLLARAVRARRTERSATVDHRRLEFELIRRESSAALPAD